MNYDLSLPNERGEDEYGKVRTRIVHDEQATDDTDDTDDTDNRVGKRRSILEFPATATNSGRAEYNEFHSRQEA